MSAIEEKRFQRIVNALLLNASFINNLGLMHGKMGIAIFFFHLSRETPNQIYENYAGELIDEIYEEINTQMPINFADGLTGIGWGIEYLVQNGFLEANTDEVLEDLDEAIYQKIMFQPTYNELQGCLLYQLTRYKNKSNGNSEKELLKKHTLLCLLGECEKLLDYRNIKRSMAFPDLDTLRAVKFFLTEIDKDGLYPQKTKKLLACLPSFLEIATDKERKIEDGTLINQVIDYAWYQLIYSANATLELENLLFQQIFDYINNEDNWMKKINNLELKKLGLAGIGMFLLNNTPNENLKLNHLFPTQNENDKKGKLNIFIIPHDFSGAKTYSDVLASYFSTRNDIKLYIVIKESIQYEEFTIKETGNISYLYIPLKLATINSQRNTSP